jgi:dihydroflavonol-4-reductase
MADVARVLKAGLGPRGKKVPSMKIPDFVVRLLSVFDPAIRSRLFELGKYRPASAEKARQVLGWAPRPNEESIMDTAESLLAEGIL